MTLAELYLLALGFLLGVSVMAFTMRARFEQKWIKLGYVAGYGDCVHDLAQENEDPPEEEPPWREERWYPAARNHVHRIFSEALDEVEAHDD